jgi:hypothetical protein
MSAVQNVNGTYYNASTHKRVIEILEQARVLKERYGRDRYISGLRLLLIYGDSVTGKVWMGATPDRGYIGRSTGINKVPLLIRNTNSLGGEAILDDKIIQIRESSGVRVLWDYRYPDLHAHSLLGKVTKL